MSTTRLTVLKETWASTLLTVAPAPFCALLVMEPWAGWPPGPFGRYAATMLVLAAVATVVVRRRAHVAFDREGIEIRFWQTHRRAWSEVESVRQEKVALGQSLVVRTAGERFVVPLGAVRSDMDRISVALTRAWRNARPR